MSLNIHSYLVLVVPSVKMRWQVVIEVHQDNDPITLSHPANI